MTNIFAHNPLEFRVGHAVSRLSSCSFGTGQTPNPNNPLTLGTTMNPMIAGLHYGDLFNNIPATYRTISPHPNTLGNIQVNMGQPVKVPPTQVVTQPRRQSLNKDRYGHPLLPCSLLSSSITYPIIIKTSIII